MKSFRGKYARGFSLMEVMVALGVFAIMAAVLLQAVAQVQEALISAQETTGKEDAKRFVLRRVLSSSSSTTLLSGGSVALNEGGAVNWSVSLEETNLPDLHKVTVELDWGSNDVEVLALWAYRPEWSDPNVRSSLMQNLRSEYPSSRFSTF